MDLLASSTSEVDKGIWVPAAPKPFMKSTMLMQKTSISPYDRTLRKAAEFGHKPMKEVFGPSPINHEVPIHWGATGSTFTILSFTFCMIP